MWKTYKVIFFTTFLSIAFSVEQPQSIRDTLESRITKESVVVSSFGHNANNILKKVKQVQIVACGTSYNAGLVAKYWLEDIAKIPCNVEVASE